MFRLASRLDRAVRLSAWTTLTAMAVLVSTSWAQTPGATQPAQPANQPSQPSQPVQPKNERPIVDPEDPIKAYLDLMRRIHGLPALGFVVFNSDEILDSTVYGVRDANTMEKVEENDLFHIGSCTKAMTATAIATLVDEGVISWDTTIGDVFPDDTRIHGKFQAVTLRQLLTHHAGVDPMTQGTQDWLRRMKAYPGTPTEQRRAFVSDILWTEPINEPGTTMAYSNAGYTVAAAMAEAKSGESWEAMLEKRVFEPLGMNEYEFGWPGEAGTVDQPRGHILQERTIRVIQPDDDYQLTSSLAPAGDVSCSLDALAKFVQAHLRAINGEPPILDKAMFDTLHKPFGGQYAMGWIVTEMGGRKIFAHEGSAGTFYCSVLIDPGIDVGIVVCVNSGGGQKACRAIIQRILLDYQPTEPAATDGETSAEADEESGASGASGGGG